MGLLLVAAARAGEVSGDRVIPTRQRGFAIPFEVPASAQLQRDTAEVQLFVSTDQGKTWRQTATTRPNFNHEPADGQFPYHAADDGEYWFAVRTLDARTSPTAEATHQPGLKVRVDTVPPKLEGEAWRDRSGGIAARWQAADSDLDATTLKIEYQATPDAAWQLLAVDPPSATNSKTTVIGEKTWFPTGGESGVVRLSVSDAAGNSNVVQLPVRASAPSGAIADHGSLPPGIGDSISESRRESNYAPSRASQRWEPDNQPPKWNDPPKRDASLYTSNEPAEKPEINTPVPFNSGWRTTENGAQREPQVEEPEAKKEIRTASTRKSLSAKLDFDLLPPNERPRMVNTSSFAIEYEIDAPGTAGVARIELWGTKDGGKNWSLFVTDEEHLSPVNVDVDGDGIYGFNILVVGRGGSPPTPPKSGDLPELWVGVDQSPPSVKLLPIELSDDGATLTVRWHAEDDMLEVRPIRLEYAESESGPWSPIITDLPNRGEYVWKLEGKHPDAAYVRVVVRDEAGNTTTQLSSAPIILSRERPQAHIRTVRPILH
jgi:hypothetical protein